MRKLIGALLAMTILSPVAAQAQDVRAEARARRGDGQPRTGAGYPRRNDATPAARRIDGGRGDRRPDTRYARPDGTPRDPRIASRPDPRVRPDGRNDDWTRSRLDRGDDRRAASRFAERRDWNRGWRNDGRYDWNRYRAAHRGAYRLPRYYAPGGWGGGYRRFPIGVGLQSSLWSRNYWIADPYAYRLPEAYGPYRWVRYYDDALLVDLNSGRIVDAVYGIFW